ncbi:MAG: tetratricopeptide repeat protein, partial [Porticoccus sp.]|nr:tetratricopeptide repeat protein [Porticoccus sp.]
MFASTMAASDSSSDSLVTNNLATNSQTAKGDSSTTKLIHVAPPSDEQHGLPNTSDINRSIENYQSAIAQQESEAGPYDPALSELSFGLGNTLLYNYRYTEAISAYKRSMHLHRVNDGVYSLSQAPMLRGIIKSHIELGQIEEASQNYR